MKMNTIKNWMRKNAEEFRDQTTGEINRTALVEAWDSECSSGEATLDPNHEAWDAALNI